MYCLKSAIANHLHPMRHPIAAACVVAALLACNSIAFAQIENPVYVDESSRAWESFQRAEERIQNNPGEAVRLLQELLDESPHRLVPVTGAARDQFTSIRSRVLQLLRHNDELLERYRSMEAAEAGRQLRADRLEAVVWSRPLTRPGLEALLRLSQQNIERAAFRSALSLLSEALEHPDLAADDEVYAWFMFGLASHYILRDDDRDRAMERLKDLHPHAEALADRLYALIEQGRGPQEYAGVSTLDQSAPLGEDLSELVAEPIWSVPLDESLFSRRSADVPRDRPIVTRALDEAKRTGMLMTAVPTIAGDVVYINEGHRISAYDRFSGSPVWSRPYVDRTSLTIADRDELRVMDMSAIAVGGERLVTLTGHAYPSTRSSDGELVCLDAETGRKQWSQRLDRLPVAQDLDGVFPHSAPVIDEGKVFVLGRRVTPQSLASCYLFAFDLETGEPVWVRHVVSSGSLRRISRAFDMLVARDGQLYVASPLGAVARIDAQSGMTLWLHRFPVSLHPSQDEQRRRPWELTSPAVTDDLVVAILPGAQRITVIDRQTGDLQSNHDATDSATWNRPAYLLTDGELVFAVGEQVRAFHVDDFDAPIWRSDDVLSQPIRGRVQLTTVVEDLHRSPAQRNQGRGGATQLIVPVLEKADEGQEERRNGSGRGLRDPRAGVDGPGVPDRSPEPTPEEVPAMDSGVVILDAETGQVRHRLELDGPGNPVVTKAQLAVAGNDHLAMYMSLSQAEGMLRERMAARSDDPEPALSLVRLAIRAGNLPLVLEASNAAIDAIDRQRSGVSHQHTDDARHEPGPGPAPDRLRGRGTGPGAVSEQARQRLFAMLVAVKPRSFEPAGERATLGQLYDIVGEIADGPDERLAYLMAYGDWLAGDEPQRALVTWQRVLDEPELASLLWEEDAIYKPARRWVIARQRDVLSTARIEDRGSRIEHPSPLAAYEQRARELLDALAGRGSRIEDPSPLTPHPSSLAADELIAFGRCYPLAEAGLEATLRGVRRLVDAGDVFAARAALITNLTEVNETLTTVLLSEYARICLDVGLETEAADALAAALTSYGDLTLPVTDDTGDLRERSITSWLTSLGVSPSRVDMPRVGNAARRAEVIHGSLLDDVGGPWRAVDRDDVRRGGAYALTAHGGVVQRHSPRGARGLAKQWEAEIARHEPAGERASAGRLGVVLADARRVVVWNDVRAADDEAGDGDESYAVMLDAESGEVKWRTPPVSEVVAQPADWPSNLPQSGMLPSGEVFEAADVLPRTDGERLVLVSRDGRVAGFAIASGSGANARQEPAVERASGDEAPLAAVSWALHCGLAQVHHAAVGDGVLVLVGVGLGGETPKMVVVDLVRGEVVSDGARTLPLGGDGVQWMALMPFGQMVYASDAGVAVVDVFNRSLVWANTSSPARTADAWWHSPGQLGMLVMRDENGWIRSVDVMTGSVSERFKGPSLNEMRAMPIEQVSFDGDELLVLYRHRLIRYDRDRRVLGSDVVLDDRRYRHMLRASDRVVVLSEMPPSRDLVPDGDDRPGQQIVRMYSMAPDGMLLDQPSDLPPLPESARHARLIDGWLLISTSRGTLAVHMPASGR